ncbi:hypothetical protein HBO23_33245 [Pseudomonas sp. WS 5532]|uniref:hypothetical protein n=1 Tax=Pseudomonas sp. WS 5532 TaxID=2717495 RepID=UPI00147656BC|nr:hypothetical protein [Pseudomonas sp. WS 5532]NMX77835.1 hypothetical protein [Pseudomonas sp. WS 5532]
MILSDDKINGLILRLDACTAAFDNSRLPVSNELLGKLRSQALIYGAFLSDLLRGQISHFNTITIETVNLISEFCVLVETETEGKHSV